LVYQRKLHPILQRFGPQFQKFSPAPSVFAAKLQEGDMTDLSLKSVITNRDARLSLRPRRTPYYIMPLVGRAIGYQRHAKLAGRWVARIRTTSGLYREKTVGVADDYAVSNGADVVDFDGACVRADEWYNSPETMAIRTEARPFGRVNGLSVCPIGPDYTVSHALAEFAEWRLKFRAPSNHLAVLSMSNAYIIPTIGSVVCADLTPGHIRSVALIVEATAKRLGAGRSARVLIDPTSLTPDDRRKRRVTANQALSILRTSLNMAFREGKIASDNAWKFAHGFPHTNLARVEHLSWTDAKRLVDGARPDLRRLILAGLYTGCRLSELFHITAGDILKQRMALYIHPLKTYRGRTIALPEEGYDFFRSLAQGRDTKSPLLQRYDGGTLKTNYVAAHFKKLCKKLGFPNTVVFHSIRHTYASLLLQSGTPPIVVSRQLGHINMTTVLKTYAHVTDDFFDVEFRSKFKPGFIRPPDLFSNIMAGEDAQMRQNGSQNERG
jgi:integrase/recombinase XerD